MKKSLSFIRDLKKNNHKEWFHANRSRYEESRSEFLVFIQHLINEIQVFDPTVGGAEPKSAIFRINRDIRFSKDKSPYKTNFGAFIVPGGKKSGNAGYYFHLDPEGTFAGGGVYHPEAPVLKKVRNEIFENGEEFRAIIQDSRFRERFGEMYDDRLKTPPKGFPRDSEHMDLLQYKSYIVSCPYEPDLVRSDQLLETVAGDFRLMYPLIRFINFALGTED